MLSGGDLPLPDSLAVSRWRDGGGRGVAVPAGVRLDVVGLVRPRRWELVADAVARGADALAQMRATRVHEPPRPPAVVGVRALGVAPALRVVTPAPTEAHVRRGVHSGGAREGPFHPGFFAREVPRNAKGSRF